MTNILNVALLLRQVYELLYLVIVGFLLCLDFGIYQKYMYNKYYVAQ